MAKVLLPAIIMEAVTVMPNVSLHLDIENQKTAAAVTYAEQNNSNIFVAASGTEKEIKKHTYGTICEVKSTLKLSGGRLKVLFQGEKRAVVESVSNSGDFTEVTVKVLEYTNVDTPKAKAAFKCLQDMLPTLFSSHLNMPHEAREMLSSQTDANTLVNMLAPIMETAAIDAILKEDDTEKRLELAGIALKEFSQISNFRKEFERDIEKNMRNFDRQAVLRARIKALEEQLEDKEVDDKKSIVENLNAPEYAKAKLLKELDKKEKIPAASPEAFIIDSYIDFVCSLPWLNKSDDNIDIKKAKEILDQDHFGLDEVKERVLEYLSVRVLSPEAGKSTILCLVGPPGVGKTSIAKSIARALDRKYVKMSLGGVKDESEIRGHRKTYIGAMAGRVLTNIANAGVSNPLFLLDEIDKLTSDMRGDPSSALLEVLDPAQNANFRDNYLEMPYDLSDVIFIATANSVQSIPKPLLDRMELIEMTGYTADEKLGIAQSYLVSKQCQNNGIAEGALSFTKEALCDIIANYTRESGVRELERKIGAVARKCARKFVEQGNSLKSIVIGTENLREYLGKPIHRGNDVIFEGEIGAAIGLAWTAVGGETLKIEVSLVSGEGRLTLTGKLGEVMQESAKTALTYIRANAEALGIDKEVFDKNDIHIHVPEGATPKDGPSAGITIATAILSALTGRQVKDCLAMTGEITLHGNVLPIGGLKEKTLAAIRSGIKTVIVPAANKIDSDEISVDKDFNFIFVNNINEVFAAAFEKDGSVKLREQSYSSNFCRA